MKRIKGITALIMMLLMVLGMSLSVTAAEAADTATITINNLGDDVTVTYKQIVEPDTTAVSGWKVVDDQAVQTALQSLCTSDITDVIAAYKAASESARMEALKNISTTTVGDAHIEVTSAGLYLINVTDNTGKFLYKPMVASVGFDFTNAAKPVLKDTDLVAKKGPVEVVKTGDEEFVEVNDIVKFTITTEIPYIPTGTTATPLFTITDTLTGGEYELTNGKLNVTCKYGNKTVVKAVDVADGTEAGTQTFTINLDDLTVDNTYANVAITLEYNAKVTSLESKNEAIPTFAGNVGKEFVYKVVTGEIRITKIGDGGAKLEGAEFVIIKGEKYALLDDEGKLTGWTADIDEAGKVTTNSEGVATAYGFDRDLDTYKVQEFKAPTGYTLNKEVKDATWQTDETDKTIVQYATAEVTDTKLSALPYTGGSGTFVFTITGILMMVGAAGLFFVAKKNDSVG